MSARFDCEFEPEVLAAVMESRWPDCTEQILRAHVRVCAICGEVAGVAQAIQDSREKALGWASIPDSGRVWWMAQMRKRREDMKTAGRPITVAQVLACACALGAVGTGFVAALSILWSQALAAFAAHGFVIAAAIAVLLLAPVSVYLVGERD